VYAGQPSLADRDRVQAVYVAADNGHAALREQLGQVLRVPVHPLDPFAREAQVQVQGDRGGFTAAVGLAAPGAASRSAPVNFLQPKEPAQQADPEKERVLKFALVGLLVLAALVGGGYLILALQHDYLDQLRGQDATHEARLKSLAGDAKHIQALKE